MMKKWLMLAAVLSLSACGFQLKGHLGQIDTLPYHTWHVDGGKLQNALESALLRADGWPISAPEAQATITVESIDTQKDVLTITRAANINQYLLSLHVVAQARRNGQPLGKPIDILVYRTLDYADSEVLGKQEEEATVWSEMRTDAAEQIVRRLSFVKAQ